MSVPQARTIGAAVSIRTLQPGDFYLLFPDLVTLGFVFANDGANSRFDFNGEHACQIWPMGDVRCVERFKGCELSFQIGAGFADRAALKTGSLVVTKTSTRHFLAIRLPEPQRFVYVDLQDWKLAETLPTATFDIYSNWKIVRGWDSMVVHEFD